MGNHSTYSTVLFNSIANTPLGNIWIAVSRYGLVRVHICESEEDFFHSLSKDRSRGIKQQNYELQNIQKQIDMYLNNKLKTFEVTIDWSNLSQFQKTVLFETMKIPYGEIRTYQEIAIQIGNPKAARAVGRVEATNPMPLIIPCHRVVGKDGKLHGYGAPGGIKTKAWLLNLEDHNKMMNEICK